MSAPAAVFAVRLARGPLRATLMQHPDAEVLAVTLDMREDRDAHVQVRDLSEFFPGPYEEVNHNGAVHRYYTASRVRWCDVRAVAR